MDINQLHEDAKWDLLLSAPLTDLLNICELSQEYHRICDNDHFWKLKVEKDFGLSTNPFGLEWVQVYTQLFQQRHLQRLTQLMQDEYLTSSEKINNYIKNARRSKYRFWQIYKPSSLLELASANGFVNKALDLSSSYRQFVYWPTYRVAGTVNDIINLFKREGVYEVYDINGNLVPLTEKVVSQSSFHPFNLIHVQYISNLPYL
jgi:hypothetical protein